MRTQQAQPFTDSPACSMTAATLRQMAAAVAIENKVIHIVGPPWSKARRRTQHQARHENRLVLYWFRQAN